MVGSSLLRLPPEEEFLQVGDVPAGGFSQHLDVLPQDLGSEESLSFSAETPDLLTRTQIADVDKGLFISPAGQSAWRLQKFGRVQVKKWKFLP